MESALLHFELTGNTPADLACALTSQREEIAARLNELSSFEIMHAYSDLADAFIRRIYELAKANVSAAAQYASEERVAIAAVGGYGRREMFPYSDIDVAFVATSEEYEMTDRLVKCAFRMLMESAELAGLKVGYSFRRADDVYHLPLDVQTALLDARYITGDLATFSAFKHALEKAIAPAIFVLKHVEARGALYSNFSATCSSYAQPDRTTSASNHYDTPFEVEPNVKEGCGGLRDLHTLDWITQIAMGVSKDQTWKALRAAGALSDWEIDEAQVALEFIARVRIVAHLIAGRALDTLTTERQVQVAESMGFLNPFDFMAAYYRHAHHIRRVYCKAASACIELDLEIEPSIFACDGRLHIRDENLPQRDLASLIRVFRHARSYGLQIGREASNLLTASARDIQVNAQLAQEFLNILVHPNAAGAIRSMVETGVLQAVIPEFDLLMYTIPTDSVHQFTVGEHSLRAVEQLQALRNDPNEQFASAFSRVRNLEILVLATLLHDVGKLDPSRPHAKSGASTAVKIATRLGMSKRACAEIGFLVRHHLLMAETARLRDLARPKTIRDFVSVVRDQRLLDMLFLLTVADIRAIGSRHWSGVQIRFLLELHERAAAAIRSPVLSADADVESYLNRHHARIRRELSLSDIPPDEIDEHCASMPISYLLNMPMEEMAAHIDYVRSVRNGVPVAELKDDPAGHFTLLTIAAVDRPGLLSDIAGVLYALAIDIHAAQVFTRRAVDNIALDMLYIDSDGYRLSQTEKRQLESALMSVLLGDTRVDELFARRRKSSSDSHTSATVTVLEDVSEHDTVLEIRAADRPGLLYYLTRKMSELGWNIHSARVATWDREARDVFYVTDHANNKLDSRQIERLSKALGSHNRKNNSGR